MSNNDSKLSLPALASRSDDEFISQPKVLKRYGVSCVTLKRWRNGHGFPAPFKVGTRSFFKLAEILEWERSQAAKTSTQKASFKK